ncbi:MAG: recombinase family protein, partial [Ruminococcus sp.]|nr:recombinase family protein [Ruminococcus sp.]
MKKVRTAAYCRVSTQYEEQESSLEIQIAYFTERINSDPQMKLVDVYAEKASALSMRNRPEFNRMIRDCRKGKIDLILTKSIS